MQRQILRLAAQNEPKATTLADANLRTKAEELVEQRLLGKVEIRGENAYRLTEFGRAAVAALGIPIGNAEAGSAAA